MENNAVVIGIDLGTSNTCAACFINNKVKILESSEGQRTTPSNVCFPEDEHVVVGLFAKKLSLNKPERGVSEIKRFIGRQFTEIQDLCNMNHLPFQVKTFPEISDEPFIVVQDKKFCIVQTLQQMTAFILQKIKKDASDKLGKNIDKAVITVPAHFNVSQRKATLEAAKLAGFTVLKLLNEPTAAALSYYHDNDGVEDKGYTLVYDLGGGTFDVAILEKREEDINIISVDGDSYLGGHDLDGLITDYLLKEIQKKYTSDSELDKTDMRRLENESALAKETLSTLKKTDIYLNGFSRPVDKMVISLSREKFEEMAIPLFKLTIDIVDRCLNNAKLAKSDITEIILAGGVTRIPKIQEMLSNHFGGKRLNKSVNPDECVAVGAALQAAMLSEHSKQNIKLFKMTEVTSSSLGVAGFTDEMNFLIRKNTPLPTSASMIYKTVRDQQKTLFVEIYEGERMNVKKNYFLGHFKISDLTPAPPGKCQITITIEIDLNGILTVTAKEMSKNNSKNLEIMYTRGRREKEILVKSDENDREEDEHFVRFVKIKKYVFNYCIAMRHHLKKQNLTEIHRDIYKKCKTIRDLVIKMNLEDEEKLRKLKEEISRECDPLVETYNFEDMPDQVDED